MKKLLLLILTVHFVTLSGAQKAPEELSDQQHAILASKIQLPDEIQELIDIAINHINSALNDLNVFEDSNIDCQGDDKEKLKEDITKNKNNLKKAIELIEDHQFKNALDILNIAGEYFYNKANELIEAKKTLRLIISLYSALILKLINASGSSKASVSFPNVLFDKIISYIKPGQYEESLRITEEGNFTSISWSPDGTKIVASSDKVKIFDSITGEILKELNCGCCNSIVSWSPDGKKIAVSGYKDSVSIWDLYTNTTSRIYEPRLGIIEITWSQNSSNLEVTNFIGNVVKLDLTGKVLDSYRKPPGFRSPDGNKITRSVKDNINIVKILDKGNELHTFELNTNDTLSAISWSLDGKKIAFLSKDIISIWDIDTGKKVARFKASGKPMALSPNGSKIAIALGKTITIWSRTYE
ncbi:MAG: hypothetical protein P4L22_02670 [Candidatus Babeliales bacterium]|nr:hypothetical protein [Candidatus Babeliales bacterium]